MKPSAVTGVVHLAFNLLYHGYIPNLKTGVSSLQVNLTMASLSTPGHIPWRTSSSWYLAASSFSFRKVLANALANRESQRGHPGPRVPVMDLRLPGQLGQCLGRPNETALDFRIYPLHHDHGPRFFQHHFTVPSRLKTHLDDHPT